MKIDLERIWCKSVYEAAKLPLRRLRKCQDIVYIQMEKLRKGKGEPHCPALLIRDYCFQQAVAWKCWQLRPFLPKWFIESRGVLQQLYKEGSPLVLEPPK